MISTPRLSPDEKAALGRDLVKAAYLEGDFVLSSGQRSRYYFDKYLFETRADLLRRVAKGLADLLPPETQRVCGPELGAVALAAAVSLETDLPFVIVRRAAKDYSTSKLVEGVLNPGDKVAVVEDIITTGAQALHAAAQVQAAGAEVLGIVGVVDREQGGALKIARAGYRFWSVFTRTELGV